VFGLGSVCLSYMLAQVICVCSVIVFLVGYDHP